MPRVIEGRRWAFRICAVFLAPLLLLATAEGVLRLGSYGYRTGFFQTIRLGQTDYRINNEDFSLRFFPPQLARWPEPIMFPAHKPRHAFRIFVLGESAARGEPEPPFSAARYLEALLGERFPGQQFEDELAAGNQFVQAQAEYEAVIRLQPTNVLAHLDNGVMLAREGQFEPAIREFEETLRLEPQNRPAQEYLARVQQWQAERRTRGQ